jgi:hypothetical protein
MKKPANWPATLCLVIALLSGLATFQGFRSGTMQLPANPAERRGYIVGIAAPPVFFLVAWALFSARASRREK